MKKILLLLLVSLAIVSILTSCDVINGILGGDEPTDTSNPENCVHDWQDATCQEPETCSKCKATKGGISDHKYSAATCTEPEVCIYCGMWYGLPLGHDFTPATCYNPRTCTVCGYEKGDLAHEYSAPTCTEPEICVKCNATGSDALGHQLASELITATCNSDGYEHLYCTVCDFTDVGEVFPMLGHDTLEYVYNGDATFERDGTATLACPYCDYSVTKTITGSAALISEAFAGKKISILGDSISTYKGISSGENAANDTNSTIADNLVWYGYDPTQPIFGGSSCDSTWWQRTINALGATRLVNNSNSGESVFNAVTGRCMQLHDDTGENAGETPDIIFIYLGTNDNYRSMGNTALLNMEDIARKGDNLNYTPTYLTEAYAIMLYRIQKTYPDAEIYCLTNLERSDVKVELTHSVSKVIREVAALFDGVYVADICTEAGIYRDAEDYLNYIPKDQGGKSIHPGTEGMRAISEVLMKTILENSRYIDGEFEALMPDNNE